MRELTPIDKYIESKIKYIEITLSRVFRSENCYNLVIENLDEDIEINEIERKVALIIINSIQKKYRERNIIYKNSTTRTIIRDWALYKMKFVRNHERTMDNMMRASKRDIKQFGRVPTQRIKGFKRVNPKAMPPIEKTW
tara:strand:- start:212 stop:628 length:417 start_codon:yes stop_codon:yes gene_type:complete